MSDADIPSIPFSIMTGAEMDEHEQANPWHIKDGKWGGWGPSYWIRAQVYGFVLGDVVEWDYAHDGNGTRYWKRVWIEIDQKWREFTAEELMRLPDLNPPVQFTRAAGACICETCGKDYYSHPKDGPLFEGHQWLHRLCNGELVKL